MTHLISSSEIGGMCFANSDTAFVISFVVTNPLFFIPMLFPLKEKLNRPCIFLNNPESLCQPVDEDFF